MIFKHKLDKGRFNDLPKILQKICNEMDLWVSENNLIMCITATWTTLEEDIALGRKSTTHREKRAVDISVKNWSPLFIQEFVQYYNLRFKKYAAISSKTNKPVLCVFHEVGFGPHIHVQINRDAIDLKEINQEIIH